MQASLTVWSGWRQLRRQAAAALHDGVGAYPIPTFADEHPGVPRLALHGCWRLPEF